MTIDDDNVPEKGSRKTPGPCRTEDGAPGRKPFGGTFPEEGNVRKFWKSPFVPGIFLALFLLGGCAAFSGKDASWAHKTVASPDVFSHPADHEGERVIVGGVIRSRDPGQIVLVAFPLDGDYFPETGKPPLGTVVIETGDAVLSGLYSVGNTMEAIGIVRSPGKEGTFRLRPYKTSINTCVSGLGLKCHSVLGMMCSCGNF